ncbi:C40 family peptidase [Nocardia sp. NEAU-G5]|uniref:C40 family peptidase n=1 Tax=Nocardia albiluteola TaxID=2842303 RepID=A0ABS6B958_9NOCA|nr:C40 family peptidase [Nocardia albiluteola]MBU3066804.1 C40 family peptidase [Nocardia albiluteola]
MGKLAEAVPALVSAATPMLMMLPLLASSLLGSGGGSGSGSGASGSSPAQQARDALGSLRNAYGSGNGGGTGSGSTGLQGAGNGSGSTGSQGSGNGSGSSGGSGATAAAIEATRIYQAHAASAFSALDNTLATEIQRFAGSHSVDKARMDALMTALDTALAQVGPNALIGAAGQQQVTHVIDQAVAYAEKLAGKTSLGAQATAQVVEMLANEYLVVLSGQGTAPVITSAATYAATGESAAVQSAISVALSEVGKPYVYGAEGPDSFDCSGLTQYSAAAAGVSIPRTAAEQYQSLPHVNPSDIKPGDLIFPAAEFNGGSPDHVIMYIGNGECVEAPHTGAYVRVVPLPSSYAASRWA